MFRLAVLLLLGTAGWAQTAESYRRDAAEFARQKSWDNAIWNYHKALELEAKDPLTLYNLALALQFNGDTREALKEFEAAADLRPKWADAHHGLGATWFDLHDEAAAMKELRLRRLSILRTQQRTVCWDASFPSKTT